MTLHVGVAFASPLRLGNAATEFGGELAPQLTEFDVGRLASPRCSPTEDALCVVTSARWLDVVQSLSCPLLIDRGLADRVDADRAWRHPHPMWAAAALLDRFATRERAQRPRPDSVVIEQGARIADGAELGDGCYIEAGAVVRDGVRLGDRVRIGANSVIGRPGFGYAHGPSGEVVHIPHLSGVDIGDDVEIGALCSVDAGVLEPTSIGARTRLDSHVHVGHHVRIGSDCWIAAQVGFAGSVVIGDGVRVGGQSGFADHVEVADRATIGAKSGVIGHVPEGVTVAGFPAVPRLRWLRAMAALLRTNKNDERT